MPLVDDKTSILAQALRAMRSAAPGGGYADPMGPQARSQAVQTGIMDPSDFSHGMEPQAPMPNPPEGVSPPGPAMPQAAPMDDQLRQLAEVYATRFPPEQAMQMAMQAWRRSQAQMGR